MDEQLERSKDGYWYDVDSGEVFGHSELETVDQVLAAIRDEKVVWPFQVTDLSSAEWVLCKMQEADASISGLEARKSAIIANIDGQIKEQRRRREWLNGRFASDLEIFAAAELAGAKTRTLTTPYGKLSFRKTTGGISARDNDAAIRWAEVHAPDAVKVSKSLLVTPLKGMEDRLPGDIFEIREPSDSFSISTGVK